MISGLAHVGGAIGALGLAAILLGPTRTWRIGGLAAWALGCASLAAWLAPSGHHRAYAAAAVAGALLAVWLAAVFLRTPWLLAVAVLACAPARIPVSVGSTSANLLLPLYVVVAGVALALAWEFLGDDTRTRELGVLALPLALVITWSGFALLWSEDRREGSIYLLFYVLPLGLLAVALARLSWRLEWMTRLYVQIAGMAVIFAGVGLWQYWTRTIFWNPKVNVDNAYAPLSWFYRVNSVFYDPSIYGRFLVVAILASLAVALFAPSPAAWGAAAVAVVIWFGLVPSFSQSSFVALGVGVVVVLAALWRRRSVVPIALAIGALFVVSLGVPQIRHRIIGNVTVSSATGGRSNLVTGGIKLALHHPVIGVGTGAFQHAYGKQEHLTGFRPKKGASHDSLITVAAENGLPGLALTVWLLFSVFRLAFGANVVRGRTGRARLALGLALVAIVTHSLFYNALYDDPLFWAALALSVVATRREMTA